MYKLLMYFCFAILSSAAVGQKEIKNYIQNQTYCFRFDDSDCDTCFSIIGKSIGNTRVVLLGEQDHGDAETYIIKTALIKYLHKNLDFDVVVFEGDFFALNNGWDAVMKDSVKNVEFLKNNIMPMWSMCYACGDLLYKYIPGNKIQVSGIDSQIFSPYSKGLLKRVLDSVVQEYKLPIINNAVSYSRLDSALERIRSSAPYPNINSNDFQLNNEILVALKEQFSSIASANEFWALLMDNLIAYNEELNVLNTSQFDAAKIRDLQMSRNLKWLITNKYQNKKIIVWASNLHIAKYYDSKHQYNTMGNLLKNENIPFYNIGFTSSTGRAGWIGHKSFPVKKPMNKSLENWIPSNCDFGYIDFSKFRGPNDEFFMYSWRYYPLKSNWSSIYDGVFYIKTMKPCLSN